MAREPAAARARGLRRRDRDAPRRPARRARTGWSAGSRSRSRSPSCSTGSRRPARPATIDDRLDGARRRLDRRSGSVTSCCCATSPSTAGCSSSPCCSPSSPTTRPRTSSAGSSAATSSRRRSRPARPGRASSPGTAAAVAVAFFALYDQGFLTIRAVARARRRDRARRRGGRPLRVRARSATCEVKDSGRAARRPRRHARPGRRPALRGRGGASTWCSPSATRDPAPTLKPVKRVALLGATGSIGRQAIEVVERNPELELCALASGSTDLADARRAQRVEHVQVGGDLAALLEALEPDVVLNAIVGFAGVRATLWALERGVTLALANKESLVAAGELALAAHGAGRRAAAAGRLRALRALPVPRGPRRGDGRLARPHRVGRPVPRPHARASSRTSRSRTRSRTRRGRWGRRSRSTRRRSRTRGSS